jgi:sterol desaturase/sphingolipid hydroxylase (fatty acid hydroxylase superfamily)
MNEYADIIIQSYKNYGGYLWREITQPSWHNYFYWLIAISVFAWLVELIVPWRKKQAIIRKDFWQDGFYMFFNFFLFSLIAYNALSDVAVTFFNNLLQNIGVTNLVAINVASLPTWIQLLLLFVVSDFIQWNVHRWLHKYSWLWRFHKIHHSVKEMGFAAHLRYHWMETIVYKTVLYLPLAMIGFGISDFLIVHIVTIAIGHLNHSNIPFDYGKLFKYVLNNPKMHIWHHAKQLPDAHKKGVNFGISLSLWDYLFGTAYVPKSGKDIELGFTEDETFPEDFIAQQAYPFKKS